MFSQEAIAGGRRVLGDGGDLVAREDEAHTACTVLVHGYAAVKRSVEWVVGVVLGGEMSAWSGLEEWVGFEWLEGWLW